MIGRKIQLWLGLVLFLAGGVLLAVARDTAELVGVGTTAGLVGIGLMGWAWFSRGSKDEG